MGDIRVEMPISEFLDRFSIIILKHHHMPKEVQEEFEALYGEYDKLCAEHFEWDLPKWLQALIDVNCTIWNLESDLRQGQLQQYDVTTLKELPQEELLQLAAVGHAAVSIRNTNRKRTSLRAALVKVTGMGWKDVKVNHVSQEEIQCPST